MDVSMRKITIIGFLALSVGAQDKASIEKKLTAKFALTQATADQADIVTAGAILVLQKGNIIMAPVAGTNYFQNTYKEGKITQNAAGKLVHGLDRLNHMPGASAPNGPATRTFVPGEKVWVTRIECKDDAVVFDLYTDAFAEVRYKAALKFPFDKHGPMPSADSMDRLTAEVFKVQPADDQQQAAPTEQPQQQQAPAPRGAPRQQAPPPPAEPVLAPIAPPPPPPEETKTLKIGMTKDEVVASFGQPEKIVKLGPKDVYYYKDLGKVTFVNGKVTDVQ
jgi:hypothetical protein